MNGRFVLRFLLSLCVSTVWENREKLFKTDRDRHVSSKRGMLKPNKSQKHSAKISIAPMEIAMEPNPNVELIHLAIQKLIDEKKNREASGRSFIEDDDDHLLLSKLLSQLESLKGDGVLKASPEPAKDSCPAAGTAEMTKSIENGGGSTKLETAEEIVKELKEVKRQNSRTHWLLSAMIVLTVVWQLSEVSLILKLKNSISHPFKSVGGMFIDMLKGKGPPDNNNGHNGEKHGSPKQQQNESAAAALPPLKLPELPHMDLHGLGLNGEQ